MSEHWNKQLIIQRLLALTLLVALMILCFKVIRFFVAPAIWGAILAYVSFPFYTFFRTKAKFSPNFSALIMTVFISLLIGVPLMLGTFYLQNEIISFYDTLLAKLKVGDLDVPRNVKDLPVIGQQIQDTLKQINTDPEGSLSAIKAWIQSHLYYGKIAFDAVLQGLAKLGMALMTLFFFFRDGENLIKQIRQALRNIIGNRIDGYLDSVGATTQAVVYGIGLTAVVQALLAGLGYAVADVPNPLLLTAITFVIALIPFGTPFAWGGVSLWLLSQGHTTAGVGLALWGILVISWVDNLIRPIVISGATKIPFIIIFIGVLGGLTAFGFVGLFIGPVVLAITLAVWREWLSDYKDEIFAPKDEKPTDNSALPAND